MKKVIFILGILLFLVIAAAVGGILYANHYVQSPAFKDRLVAEISKVTGGTVQIDTINVSLTSRVEVGGIKMDRSDQKTGSQAFSTKKFLVKFNPWGLLRKRIEIEEIILESPDIKVVSAPRSAAPSAPSPGTAAPAGGGEPTTPAAETPGAKPSQAPAETSPPPSVAKPAIDLVIQKATVRDGRLDITLPNGKRVLLENFNLQSAFESTQEPIRFKGSATCQKVSFDAQPPITNLDATFRFDKDTLFIEKATGTILRGTVEAKGQAKIEGDQPFELQIKCANADLKALLEAKPDLAQAVEGAAHADVTLAGNFSSPLDATGKGSARIEGGKVKTTQLKQQIAQVPLGVLVQCVTWAIQLPELETLVFNKCESDFTIARQKVNFSRIDAQAEHVRLKSDGVFGFDQTIDFNVHAAISQQVRDKVPPVISALFVKDADNLYGFDFRVFGTVEHPEHDVIQRVGAGNIDAIGRAVESLIPQGAVNNLFDTLDGALKGEKNPADPNAPAPEKKPGLLDSIFGGSREEEAPPPPPPDNSTNAAPKKGVFDKIEDLF